MDSGSCSVTNELCDFGEVLGPFFLICKMEIIMLTLCGGWVRCLGQCLAYRSSISEGPFLTTSMFIASKSKLA